MSQAIYCVIASFVAVMVCYSAPARTLSGFAPFRFPLIGIAALSTGAAWFFGNALFAGVASFCLSFAVIGSITMTCAYVWAHRPAAEQNSRALLMYPSVSAACAVAGYLCAGTAGVIGAIVASLLLVGCVYARDRLKPSRRTAR